MFNPSHLPHPTKVTFTFQESKLKQNNQDLPASFWSGYASGDHSAYDIQKWLAIKMRSQREKIKLEKAVRRAEKKLQEEYEKQMEAKKIVAAEQFRNWLKNKGFANQAPNMLHREPSPVRKVNSAPSSSEWTRPKTSRKLRAKGSAKPDITHSRPTTPKLSKQRPKSAGPSHTRPRRRISSTLEVKPAKSACKALCPEDYMKMKHLAGKRYKKLKEEKLEFHSEDALLRQLQELDWEEKCIKNKMVYSEKSDLETVKVKALKKKRKMRFRGDVITVEVEELDEGADVEVLFEEQDAQYSDIGCLENDGIDFHIESRETIDLNIDTAVSSTKNLATIPPSPPPAVQINNTDNELDMSLPNTGESDGVSAVSVNKTEASASDEQASIAKKPVRPKTAKSDCRKSISESDGKSVEKLVEKPAEKTAECSIEKVTENLPEKPIQNVTEKPAEKVTDKTFEIFVKTPTENLSKKTIENVTEKSLEKTVEKSVKILTEKSVKSPADNLAEKPTENKSTSEPSPSTESDMPVTVANNSVKPKLSEKSIEPMDSVKLSNGGIALEDAKNIAKDSFFE